MYTLEEEPVLFSVPLARGLDEYLFVGARGESAKFASRLYRKRTSNISTWDRSGQKRAGLKEKRREPGSARISKGNLKKEKRREMFLSARAIYVQDTRCPRTHPS